MNTRKIATTTITSVTMLSLAASNAFAAKCWGSGCTTGIVNTGFTDLLAFIQAALNTVIGLAALIAVGFLVYSGIQYIMAAGDEGKVEKATKGIMYSVIGLVICFISVLIVNFVLTTFLGQ